MSVTSHENLLPGVSEDLPLESVIEVDVSLSSNVPSMMPVESISSAWIKVSSSGDLALATQEDGKDKKFAGIVAVTAKKYSYHRLYFDGIARVCGANANDEKIKVRIVPPGIDVLGVRVVPVPR